MRVALVSLVCALVALGACEADAPKSKGKKAGAPECAPLEPEVLLVVEASRRMVEPMPGAKKGSRWDWLVKALKKELPHVKNDADLALLVFPGVVTAPDGQATVDGKSDSGKPPGGDKGKGKDDGDKDDGDKDDGDKDGKDDKGKDGKDGKVSCGVGNDAPVSDPVSPGPVAVVGGGAVLQGTRSAQCAAPDPQVPFGSPYGHIVSTLEHVRPSGSAPIAAALRSAADTFAAREPSGRSRHVVLIVAGDDSCDGDALAEIQALRALGVDVWVGTFDHPHDSLVAWAVAGGHPSMTGGPHVLQSDTKIRDLSAAVVVSATAEVCDGLDNDCDGEVDEGLIRACLDECGGGEQSCIAGSWRACGMTDGDAPEELCDGVDNDCDGEVDEGFGVGEACSDEVGPCSFGGTLVCSPDGMSATCDTGDQWPGPEVCDGLDNDCDGQVDEGADAPCTDGCRDGVRSCVDGVLGACVLGDLIPELCDGVDNDCDGEVDEGFDVGATCVVASGGCIAMGVMVCTEDGASSVCGSTSPTSPAPEQCNGVDDDCDGVVDNGVALCPGKQVCYAGQCIYD